MPERERLDTYRNILFTIPKLSGINQTLAPNLINDDECQQIWNFLPIAHGVLRKIKAAKKLVNITSPPYPIKMISHPLQGQYRSLIFFDNGSVYSWDLSNLTQVAPAGTLSGDKSSIDVAVWQNSAFYIIDSNGYFKWTGTTWSQVSSVIKGHAIVVWQGRVFVANGSRINYSVALNPEDFAGAGSGYFDLAQSFPELKIKVKKIVPYIDSLIIYGDNAIMGLTGSTISNDPSTWYLTQVSNTIGISQPNNVVSYGNEVWLLNEKGLFRTTMSQQVKFDYKIDVQKTVKIEDSQSTISTINNLNFYLVPATITSPMRGVSKNILAYCIDIGEFYFIDLGFDIYGIYRSYIEGTEYRIYALAPDGLYGLFEGDTSIKCLITSKSFDLGKQTMEKLWYFLTIPTYFYQGTFNLEIAVNTDKSGSVLNKTISILPDMYQWRNPTGKYTFGKNLKVWGFNIKAIKRMLSPVFIPKVSGLFHELNLKEEGSSIFEIVGFSVRAQLGRDIV